jgi:hypothetical protein
MGNEYTHVPRAAYDPFGAYLDLAAFSGSY